VNASRTARDRAGGTRQGHDVGRLVIGKRRAHGLGRPASALTIAENDCEMLKVTLTVNEWLTPGRRG
jgi:hypothetical protein